MTSDAAGRQSEGARRRAATTRPALLLLLPLAAYAVFLLGRAAPGVGGSDSASYANTAKRLASGTLVARPRSLDRLGLPDELVAITIPLGFVPGPRPGTMAPFYPVGFAGHLAATASVVGWERAIRATSPLAALGCLVLVYLLARELSLSRAAAASAAAILAAWPTFLFQALQPMGDVAAAFWCLAAVLCARRSRRRTAWAAAAGAAFGIALLVRPTCLLLAPALALALPSRRGAWSGFLAGGLPFAALLAAYDTLCYGRPWTTGWSHIGLWSQIALANFPPRAASYGLWILRTLTPLVPLGWLAVAALRRLAARDRALLLLWFAPFFLFHCLYGPSESVLFLRFLLPGVPALVLGAVIAAADLGRAIRLPVAARVLGVATLAAIIAIEVRWTRRIGAVRIPAEEGSVYRDACRAAVSAFPGRSVVLTMAASGALEYYTDLAYLRWDMIRSEDFPALRAKLEARGERLHALLFPSEEGVAVRGLPGSWVRIGSARGVGLWRLDPETRLNAPERAAAAPSSRRPPPPP